MGDLPNNQLMVASLLTVRSCRTRKIPSAHVGSGGGYQFFIESLDGPVRKCLDFALIASRSFSPRRRDLPQSVRGGGLSPSKPLILYFHSQDLKARDPVVMGGIEMPAEEWGKFF